MDNKTEILIRRLAAGLFPEDLRRLAREVEINEGALTLPVVLARLIHEHPVALFERLELRIMQAAFDLAAQPKANAPAPEPIVIAPSAPAGLQRANKR